MRKFYSYFFTLFFIILGFGFNVFAAEVLQVSNSSTLLIGDNNRTYKVKLTCLEILPENEQIALNWLRIELPRKTRVNIRPKGFEEGALLASIIPLKSDSELDINQKLTDEGLAKKIC
tara:strand:- start:242 stop:595 length:354 start_codon:yes stop_codon:yes gene_type:complete